MTKLWPENKTKNPDDSKCCKEWALCFKELIERVKYE